MKKGLFIVGLVLVLIGAVFSQEYDVISDHIESIEHEGVHDNLMEAYDSSFEQIEDNLDGSENREYASYGVAMLGIIFIILSFMKRKDKDSGLLYQKGDKQRISPKDLEKSITNISPPPNIPMTPIMPVASNPPTDPQPSSAPGGGSPSNDLFELPSLGGSGSMMTPPAGSMSPSQFAASPMDPDKEYSLFCPNCGQGFSVKGAIKTVICPRCGKRFDTDRAKKA